MRRVCYIIIDSKKNQEGMELLRSVTGEWLISRSEDSMGTRPISPNAFRLRARSQPLDAFRPRPGSDLRTIPLSTPEIKLTRSWGDMMPLLQGADAGLVDEMLDRLPPSFFIVGAPRCGTTTLSSVLGGHPAVSVSRPKETHFLLEDRSALRSADVRRLYLQAFHPLLARDTQAIGDGSVSYLYEPDAIRRALEFDRRARFIIAVRNPLDQLRSYHARMLFTLDEVETDFNRAWALQDDRAAGRHVPKHCRDSKLLQYREVAALGKHVQALFRTAGRDRCEVVVFDDLSANPAAVYERPLRFLALPDDGRREFKVKREHAGFRYRWLQALAMNPPPWAFHILHFSNTALLNRLQRVRKRIKRFNTAPAKRSDFAAPVRSMLQDYFRSDVELLSDLLDRDLTHWLQR